MGCSLQVDIIDLIQNVRMDIQCKKQSQLHNLILQKVTDPYKFNFKMPGNQNALPYTLYIVATRKIVKYVCTAK